MIKVYYVIVNSTHSQTGTFSVGQREHLFFRFSVTCKYSIQNFFFFISITLIHHKYASLLSLNNSIHCLLLDFTYVFHDECCMAARLMCCVVSASYICLHEFEKKEKQSYIFYNRLILHSVLLHFVCVFVDTI